MALLLASVLALAGFVGASNAASACDDHCKRVTHTKIVKAKNIKKMNKKLRKWNARGYHIKRNLNPNGYKFKLVKIRKVCK